MTNQFITIKEAGDFTGKADLTIRRLIKRLLITDSQMISRLLIPSGFIYKIDKRFLIKHYKLNDYPTTQATNQTSTQNDKSDYSKIDKNSNDTEEIESDKPSSRVSTQNEAKDDKDSKGSQDFVSNQMSSQKIESDKPSSQNESAIITLLKENTSLLKGQLKVKDGQISSLGKKIDGLIERDRERNILFKQLQDRVYLLEKPKGVIDQETSEEATEGFTEEIRANKHKVKDKPKRKGNKQKEIKIKPVIKESLPDKTDKKQVKPKRRGFWSRLIRK